MSKNFYGHILKAEQIIARFDRQHPLHYQLKEFFRTHKECGSKDRKVISQTVYNFFRLGRALENLPLHDRLAVANYLIDNISYDKAHLIADDALTVRIENVKQHYPAFELSDVFPFTNLLSDKINLQHFALSFLQRPLVWLRVKSNGSAETQDEFNRLNIEFRKHDWGSDKFETWSVASESKLTATQSYLKGLFEIQDLSSQQTLKHISVNPADKVWDCCCGAGGKSLLIHNIEPEVKITATDVRQQSLNNLKERFKRAGIINYESYVADASQPFNEYPEKSFELIIADVPCSGSGTWARTPEMLTAFDTNSLTEFSERQFNIACNAFRYLKPGGHLVYITCSVFQKENEAVVNRLAIQMNTLPLLTEYIINHINKADSMFVAVFKKNS